MFFELILQLVSKHIKSQAIRFEEIERGLVVRAENAA